MYYFVIGNKWSGNGGLVTNVFGGREWLVIRCLVGVSGGDSVFGGHEWW